MGIQSNRILDSSGRIEDSKSKLRAKDFQQVHSYGKCETNASEVQFISTHSLLNVVGALHLELNQMKVTTALPNRGLDEYVWMRIPECVTGVIRKCTICKPVKSLHGLKRAPRRWNARFDSILLT